MMLVSGDFYFGRVGRKIYQQGGLPLYLETKGKDEKDVYAFDNPVRGHIRLIDGGCVLECDSDSDFWVVMIAKDDTDLEDSEIIWSKGGDVYSLGHGIYLVMAYGSIVYLETGVMEKNIGACFIGNEPRYRKEKDYVLEIYKGKERCEAALLEISHDLYEYLIGEKI